LSDDSDSKVREGLAYLAGLARFGIVPTLDRMYAMLESLGRPETRYATVHVAGTNGKGSTARFIAAALQEAGQRVGLFTSPHLVHYNERIMVQGEPIDNASLLGLLDKVKPLAAQTSRTIGHPTEFEMSTIMAFLHFAREDVDVAVIETGMGGVWDCTNVLQPLLSVITSISMDHTERLGGTLAEIAAQKAGIIKPGRPVVVAPQEDAAAQVLEAAARAQGAPLTWVRSHAGARPAPSSGCQEGVAWFAPLQWDLGGGRFHLTGPQGDWRDLRVAMLGPHQITNAAVAATACQELIRWGWSIGEEHVRAALLATRWPGRLEIVSEAPVLLLDGAHNAGAARALGESLQVLFPGRRRILVLGVLAEKEVLEVLAALLPQAAGVVCTAPASSRSAPLSPADLAAAVRRVCEKLDLPDLELLEQPGAGKAVRQALAMAGPDDVVCVCGSLYLVGEIRGAIEMHEGGGPWGAGLHGTQG
jgi:dihydrofolate synthase/folylpolyglutamate synthase